MKMKNIPFVNAQPSILQYHTFQSGILLSKSVLLHKLPPFSVPKTVEIKVFQERVVWSSIKKK